MIRELFFEVTQMTPEDAVDVGKLFLLTLVKLAGAAVCGLMLLGFLAIFSWAFVAMFAAPLTVGSMFVLFCIFSR